MRAVMLAFGAGAMVTPAIFWHQFHDKAQGARLYSLASLLFLFGVLVCVWLAGRQSAHATDERSVRRLSQGQRLAGTVVVALAALALAAREFVLSAPGSGVQMMARNLGLGLLLGFALTVPVLIVTLPVFLLRHRQLPRRSGWRSKLPADALCIAAAGLALLLYGCLEALMARLSPQALGCSDASWDLLPALFIAAPTLLAAAWLPPRGASGLHGPVSVSSV